MRFHKFLDAIKTKKATIGVVGLGYVGLPLAILFAQNGFSVTGLVRDPKKIPLITKGHTYLADLGIQDDLQSMLHTGALVVKLLSPEELSHYDILVVCVPTPVDEKKNPDLTAIKQVSSVLTSADLTGKLVVNESTVAPGTTREVFGKLKGDYFLVCSPERVDPGNREKDVAKIPKVVGGRDAESTELGTSLYRSILNEKVITVSSLEAAEMAKMIENTYRAVNIALVNEFAILADRLSIDIMEVIAAAKTKWSFQPHYPGMGVGGHCIPVDPYYVLELAQKKHIAMPVVAESLQQNEEMPRVFLKKFLEVYDKSMTVVVYGIAYKKNIKDLRESPAVAFCTLLKARGIPFSVYDPYYIEEEVKRIGFFPAKKIAADVFIVATDHDALEKDYKAFVGTDTTVIDGRNFFNRKVGRGVIGIGRSYL